MRIVAISTITATLMGITSLEGQTSGPRRGQLVIHGGGGGAVCREAVVRPLCEEYLDEFVRMAGGQHGSIVIIPTAALFEDPPPPAIPLTWQSRELRYDDAFRKRYTEMFRSRGVASIAFLHAKDRNEADSAAFVAEFTTATGVWIIGGRQWILADAYGGTRTEQALHDLLDRGGVVGGGSAAAAIQASYLVRSDPRGNRAITGERDQGFGFLRNAAIDIHVLSWNRQFDLLSVVEQHPEILGIGIDADAAIVVHGNQFRVIGIGNVAIYDAKFVRANRKFYFLERGERFDLATRRPFTSGGRSLRIPSILPDVRLSQQALASIAGRYEYHGMPIVISVTHGRIVARLAPDDERELVPVSEDTFIDAVLGSEVTFERTRGGQATALTWVWPRCSMTAMRKIGE